MHYVGLLINQLTDDCRCHFCWNRKYAMKVTVELLSHRELLSSEFSIMWQFSNETRRDCALLPPPKNGGYVFNSVFVCLSGCLFVSLLDYSKSYERITMNFVDGWSVTQGPLD